MAAQFSMRISDLDEANLSSLGKHYGIDRPQVVRMLLKLEADALRLYGRDRADIIRMLVSRRDDSAVLGLLMGEQ